LANICPRQLARYPISSTTRRILNRVSSLRVVARSGIQLTAWLTADFDTPARRATSANFGRDDEAMVVIYRFIYKINRYTEYQGRLQIQEKKMKYLLLH
jgi:hypothetical protein